MTLEILAGKNTYFSTKNKFTLLKNSDEVQKIPEG